MTSLQLCITMERLVLPQHAIISRAKNTIQQQYHSMPGYHRTLMKRAQSNQIQVPFRLGGLQNFPVGSNQGKKILFLLHIMLL